ncbi:hypothetical protein [Sporisorium scitamineum]|uniref:Uncharacterized protein n=1 Tax=Sporisorium scitamineum TaxID=49012 RepID=A0A0F7RYP0_9BASI|nr:hypothetical protein [Sporisorium scitamineum]
MAVPPSGYYGGGADDGSVQRQRADNRLSMIPPQLAKLGLDPSMAAGQNMSGLVSRDDPLREWERRQNGLAPSSAANMSSSSKKRQSANYQQLDLLQQQAELGGAVGGSGSGSGGGAGSFSVVVDGSQDRVGKGNNNNTLAGLSGAGIAAPPAAYSSNSGGGAGGLGRYQTSPGLGYNLNGAPMSASHSSGGTSANVNASTLPFDIYDAGMSNLLPPSLTPMQARDKRRDGSGGFGGL